MLKLGIRKYDHFRLYYHHDAVLVGQYQMPQLAPVQWIPHDVVSYSEWAGIRHPEKHWLDFFIDDAKFENFWNTMEQRLPKLRKFEGVITTDYSMLPEMLPGVRLWNATRNRVTAYFLQQQGLRVIPVASWCGEEDFDWCFDGLPEESSIAVSTNGCLSSPYGRRIFLAGVEELQRQKHPSHLIVCGRSFPELDRYGNVFRYPSFSQRWKERV